MSQIKKSVSLCFLGMRESLAKRGEGAGDSDGEKVGSAGDFFDKYTVEKPLNMYSSSEFHMVSNKNTLQEYLLKKVFKHPDHPTIWMNERKFMFRVKHQNIVKYIDYYENAKCAFFVMEYIPGPDLHTIVLDDLEMQLPETRLSCWFIQMASAIRFLHNTGIAHCDIKLENFVNHDEHIKLIDFGLSRSSIGRTLKKGGTCYYLSPECLRKIRHNICTDDIWALGICLYACLYRLYPFSGDDDDGMYYQIMQDEPKYDPLPSELCFDLLKLSLTKDHNHRINIHEFCNHKWFIP